MRVTSLGSGSSGNALLVEAGPQRRTKLLVDAGFTGRVLIERMRCAGVTPEQLQGILITHEHIDHIVGLPTFKKRYAVPVITDSRTLEAIEQIFANGLFRTDSGQLVQLDPTLNDEMMQRDDGVREVDELQYGDVQHITAQQRIAEASSALTRSSFERPLTPPSLAVGSRCAIGDIEIQSFPVSHDAVAPCGYLLSAGGCRVCIVIDTGEVTPIMVEAMHQADLLIVESNHDRERLIRGPYPYQLKQRILSSTGHLSNDQAADAVLRTWRTDSIRWLWLSHLSRTNNTPKIAQKSMLARIQAAKANPNQVHITVLPPHMGGVWDSAQLWHVPSLWEMQIR